MDTTTAAAAHLVTVDDIAGVTACTCGLHVFTRPRANPLMAMFIAEHTAIMGL